MQEFYLTAYIIALTAGVTSVQADNAEGNAALIYQQAFKAAQQVADAGADRATAISTGAYDDAIRLAHRAALIENCDWGLPDEPGTAAFFGVLHHERAATDLVKLACDVAQWRFRQGDAERAMDGIEAGLALSRRICPANAAGMLVTEYRMELLVVQCLQENWDRLDADLRARVGDLYLKYDGWTPAQVALRRAVANIQALRSELRRGDGDAVRRALSLPFGSSATAKSIMAMADAELDASLRQAERAAIVLASTAATGDETPESLKKIGWQRSAGLPDHVNWLLTPAFLVVDKEQELARAWRDLGAEKGSAVDVGQDTSSDTDSNGGAQFDAADPNE